MAILFKYEGLYNHIYKNKGMLEDAYRFNLIDKGEKVKESRRPVQSIRRIVYRIATLLLFLNYFLLRSIAWLFRPISIRRTIIWPKSK